MAYKLFSTGEVLTAANVNNYLMKQTVMVFADAATRTTALSGVLAEGMISYRSDAKVLEIYNGSAWVDFSGDITGVTAGTGLTGGGTSGTVTLTLDPTVPYGYSTTATAAGTTTLTAASNRTQMFTGTTTQTVVLPVASTMTLGQAFTIHNNSTGSLTVQSSGLNNVIVIPAGNTYQVTSILTSGTTAASWDADFTGTTATTGSGSTVLNSAPTIDSPTVTGTLTAGGSAGTSGQYLQSTASGIQWATASAGGMTLLSTTALSGTSTTISSISQSYINLMVLFQGVGNSTGSGYFRVAFNGNTSNAQCAFKNSSGTAWVNGSGYFFPMGQDAMASNYGASSGMVIEDYTSTALKPVFSAGNGFSSTSQGPTFASGSYSNSEAISSLVLTTSNGGTLIGTVKIYGVK